MKMHERLRVIRASRVAPSERHLLTVIACYLGEHDDGPAFPSVGTMAKETGYAESQVHNLLRSMLASGLITRKEGGPTAAK
jgi:DNA-binding MarR family transcriptional regulator